MAKFWEAIRPWGSMKRVQLFLTERDNTDRAFNSDDEDDCDDDDDRRYPDFEDSFYKWEIQVTFCYKDEARHFADNVKTVCGWNL